MGVVGLDGWRDVYLGVTDLADVRACVALWVGWSDGGIHHAWRSLERRRRAHGGGKSAGVARPRIGGAAADAQQSGARGLLGGGGEDEERTTVHGCGAGAVTRISQCMMRA